MKYKSVCTIYFQHIAMSNLYCEFSLCNFLCVFALSKWLCQNFFIKFFCEECLSCNWQWKITLCTVLRQLRSVRKRRTCVFLEQAPQSKTVPQRIYQIFICLRIKAPFTHLSFQFLIFLECMISNNNRVLLQHNLELGLTMTRCSTAK